MAKARISLYSLWFKASITSRIDPPKPPFLTTKRISRKSETKEENAKITRFQELSDSESG